MARSKSTPSHKAYELLANAQSSPLIRVATAGSVDNGKSTLIGRLLYDSQQLYHDHRLKVVQEQSQEHTKGLALANITDGLRAEREQGITIDVAHRYFSCGDRRFILADSPGHEQYTRNMATAASTAHISIIVTDAVLGITDQTKRHAFISALLGVPRFLLAVNKMDLVGFSEERFIQIKNEFQDFAAKLSVREINVIPISALDGDNVCSASDRMPWYEGVTVTQYLSQVYVGADSNLVDLRFPVQYVQKGLGYSRRLMGTIVSGSVSVGDALVALPSNIHCHVKSLYNPSGVQLSSGDTGEAVSLEIVEHVDIGRGVVLVKRLNQPRLVDRLESMVVWFSGNALRCDNDGTRPRYLLRHGTRLVKVLVEQVRYEVEVTNLHKKDCQFLSMNAIGRVSFQLGEQIPFDAYQINRAMGNGILIDSLTGETCGAVLFIERHVGDDGTVEVESSLPLNRDTLHRETSTVTSAERIARAKLTPSTIWLTGLPASGKSTIGKAIERWLFDEGLGVIRLDGDNLRFGLNKDLGFSRQDRSENIRRSAEVAKLANDAGLIAICCFVSPFAEDRKMAENIIGKECFYEVFVSTSVTECKRRDPYKLYERAERGEIADFTGVSSPYEIPLHPALVIDGESMDIAKAVKSVISILSIGQ